MDTTSIINRPLIDVNKIVADDFDISNIMIDEDRQSFDLLASDPLTAPFAEEVKDKYKMAAFVEGVSGKRVSDINANATMLAALTSQKNTISTWQSMKNSWKNGRTQMDLARTGWEMMNGWRSIDYDAFAIEMLPTGADNWVESSLNAATEMAPMMLQAGASAIKHGAVAGLGAAGIAALAGQAGPQVAVPEEIITVPATFAAIGATYGGAKAAMEIEAGLMFVELLHMQGPNGERVNPQVAIAIASGVGLVNGLLEMAQIDELIKTIPGGKNILRKSISRAVKKTLRDKTLLKIAGKNAAAYTKTVTRETLQELAQESSNIVGGELAKILTNAANEGKIKHASVQEIMDRYHETAIQSVQAFSVIAAPGHIGGVVVDVVNEQNVRVKPKVAPDQEIGREVEIKPRIDPLELHEPGQKAVNVAQQKNIDALARHPKADVVEGTTRVRMRNSKGALFQVPAAQIEKKIADGYVLMEKTEVTVTLENLQAEFEAKAKITDNIPLTESERVQFPEIAKQEDQIAKLGPPPAKAVVEEGISEEEQAEIDVIEQEVAKIVPAKVKPKLYIGNVTERMKKQFAGIWGKQPSDVSPFLEGPFPTKRTAIEMTSDQANATLVMLEASLAQRLTDNLIRTENDLARANADWGDIKELRRVLDLPETTRPFTVTRAAKSKIIVPGTVRQRVSFAVQLSKADIVTTTKIEQLNSILRKMRKSAKEGFAAAVKHYREVQYLRRQIELRNKLVRQIKAVPSKGIDPFYAKAITEIQTAIDFKATEKKVKGHKRTQVEHKAGLRQFLENNPDRINEIPETVLASLDKRDIASLTLAQIQQIRNEVKRLSVLGRLKSKKMRAQRKAVLAKNVETAIASVRAARKPLGVTPAKAWTLRPLRILDMLDGLKNFAGPLVNMFDTAIQNATETELTHVDHRQQKATAKLKELGLTLFHFARKRKVGKVNFTIDDMLGIYAGWMNEQSRLALQHGGVKMDSGRNMPVTEELYDQIVAALTEEEKKWAEFIIEEYADNWTRLRAAVIVTEGRDLGRVPNYTKMRRIGVDKANSDDILGGFDYSDESDYRLEIVEVDKRFTIDRQNIPPEYQLPIDTSLTKVWQGEMRKQEHYIAMAKLLKDLNAVVVDKQFAETVKSKFGDSIYDSLKEYLKRTANPDYYKSFDDVENLSRALRKNTAIAFLAFNLLTIAKQAPSVAFYAIQSSYSDILMSAIQVAVSPRKTYEAILSHNKQIGHAAIVREMEELKHTNKAAHSFIVRRIGNAGLRGIMEMDRIVRVIGENAVINSEIRKGLSLEDATKKARQASLRGQPAAAAKDIAQLYANNEVLNWFTRFTNQLNQIYNIATHDIFAAWYNKKFAEVGRSIVALGIAAAWIWALKHKELPDDEDDIFDAMTDQALASVPIVGTAALAGKQGWDAPTPTPLTEAAKVSQAVFSGEMDRIMPALFKGTAISIGIPFVGLKRIHETVEEQDLWELIGGRD